MSRRRYSVARPATNSECHSSSVKKFGAPQAKHNQGFDGSAPITDVSMNFKIAVQRVPLDLGQGSLGAAYRARVRRLEHNHRILNTHVCCPRWMPLWKKHPL